MRFPDEPGEGGKIIQWARQVQAYLRSLTPQLGGDLIPDRSPRGTRWVLKPRAMLAGTQPLPDFSAYDAGASGGPPADQANLGITNGNVASATSSLVFQEGVGPMPAGMGATHEGGNPIPYEFPVDETDTVAYIGMTIDDTSDTVRTVTSLYIASDAAMPVSTDDTTCYIQLCTFVVKADYSIVITAGASGIGDQVIAAGRDWFDSDGVSFDYIPGPA